MGLFRKNKGNASPQQGFQQQQQGFQQGVQYQQVPQPLTQQGFQQQPQVFQQQPIFQTPPPPTYNSNDRPIVEESVKKFIKRELGKQRLKAIIETALSSLVLLSFIILITLFVTGEPKYTFDTSTLGMIYFNGIEHLGWMGTLGIVSLFIFSIYSLRLYSIVKDFQRFNLIEQNQAYVPLTLKKRYRSMKANNTFIHYFAFLAYLGIGISVGVIYMLDFNNGILGQELVVEALRGKFEFFAMYLGISAACVLILHFVWVFLRVKKGKVYDSKFGYEIVDNKEIIELKKRNRKICIFLTLVLILVGVLIYFIVKKLKPGLPKLLPSLKK